MKRLLVCLSAANLLFLKVWNSLLGKKWYYDVSDISYSPILLLATVFLVLLGGVILYLFDLFIIRWIDRVKFIRTLLLIASPFLFFTFGQAIYTFATIHFYTNEGPVPYFEVKEGQPRIALLLFDELDIRAAFDQRPPNLKLPHLDAFKDQSFFAAKAFAAGPTTRISIPALLTGMHLSNIEMTAHDQARLTLTSSQQQVILDKNLPSLFSRMRDLGYNCGIKGTYNPYYKLFGPSLSQCEAKSHYSHSLYEGTIYIFQKAFQVAQQYFMTVDSKKPHIVAMAQKNDRPDPAQEAVHQGHIDYWSDLLLNKKLHLSFVHFPYPHPPGLYDYEREKFCQPGEGSYLGNVKMVDITLADIRQRMQEASLWDETTIIITSDHWLRKYWPSCGYSFKDEELKFVTTIDHRVPFIIKLAGQKEPFVLRAFQHCFGA